MSDVTTEEGLVERVRASLRDYGIQLRVTTLDGAHSMHLISTVTRGKSEQTYAISNRGSARLAEIAADWGDNDDPLLVLDDYIHPRSADTLRRAGINYADAAGNAWLEFDDVLIDVRGRPRKTATINAFLGLQERPKGAAGNVFSSGRSQVICALLTWPRLWKATTREQAVAAGVSVGLAHDTLQLLHTLDYREDPRSTELLLERWTASFPTGLERKLTLASLNGDPQSPVQTDGEDVYIGGEGAVPDLIGGAATVTIYVPELRPRLIIANRWRTDGPPNVTIRRAFWKAPPDDPFGHVTPWPLVYADLWGANDPRLRNVAQEWKARFVQHR